MKCVNCDNKAEHQHHVVPKVKGGTFTIPLCVECHAKVHDKKSMSSSHLVRMGLIKRDNAVLATVLWLKIEGETNDFISSYLKKHVDKNRYSVKWIKKSLDRMFSVKTSELIDLLDPVLKLNKDSCKYLGLSQYDYFIAEWEEIKLNEL